MPSFKMKFSGVTILQGVEFSIFHIDFEWALQQCSTTALPVMVSGSRWGCRCHKRQYNVVLCDAVWFCMAERTADSWLCHQRVLLLLLALLCSHL